LISYGLAFGTEVVFGESSNFPNDTFREKCPMKLARMLVLLGLVTAVLLIAAGGKFHIGILLTIVLTALICLLEPSMAK
jgi:hypothetical protein